MIRIGILGCGRIGQVHAKTLRGMDTATIIAVSDFFPDAAQKLAKQCGAAVRDTHDIIAADDIDAIIVGTPTDTHFDIISKRQRCPSSPPSTVVLTPTFPTSNPVSQQAKSVTLKSSPFCHATQHRRPSTTSNHPAAFSAI